MLDIITSEREARSEFLLIYTKNLSTSKTPDVAIDERGLVRSIHLFLFLFSCVH